MISSTPEPVLQFSKVSKSFPSPAGIVEVLREVDLTVRRGDFVVITGPSGSGKSTLLSLAGLLDQPSAGTLRFEGQSLPPRENSAVRELRGTAIGMVFQRFHLLERRTVLDNVIFRHRYLPHDPTTVRQKALELLDTLGLSAVAQRPAWVLSSGEMQRVAIARAMVLTPRLLLADEPTGNLDRAAADDVMSCFRELHQQGMTILMATHNDAWLAAATRHVRCADKVLLEAA